MLSFSICKTHPNEMHTRLALILLLAAGSVHAADSQPSGKPMAWPYRLLETAQDAFEQRAPMQAPGATLAFSLPKVPPEQGDNQVELVQGDQRIALPMVSGASFALPRDLGRVDGAATVVANRHFRKGETLHPNIAVRSPGLPDNVRRMGDLRLACAAQMEMAKAEGFKFRAVLAAAGMFGLGVCKELEVTKIDVPQGAYDTVTIEDGARRLVQGTVHASVPRLGDGTWSDEARISYSLVGRSVPQAK